MLQRALRFEKGYDDNPALRQRGHGAPRLSLACVSRQKHLLILERQWCEWGQSTPERLNHDCAMLICWSQSSKIGWRYGLRVIRIRVESTSGVERLLPEKNLVRASNIKSHYHSVQKVSETAKTTSLDPPQHHFRYSKCLSRNPSSTK